MTTAVNYTPEMTAELVGAYEANPTQETVNTFAEKFHKSAKSVVAKLTREGVYQKKEYATKNGEAVTSKAAMVAQLAEMTGQPVETLESLEKATKKALQVLLDKFATV